MRKALSAVLIPVCSRYLNKYNNVCLNLCSCECVIHIIETFTDNFIEINQFYTLILVVIGKCQT